MRLVLYTGKGGVGKTTTAAASAALAAERGLCTLVVSADPAHSLGDVLEAPVGSRPQPVAPGLHALEVDARRETQRRWGRLQDYLAQLLRHSGVEDVLAEELALLPGAEELATLLAVEEQAASGAYDLVVVDCAPTDATLRLLTLPDVATRSLRVLLPLLGALAGAGAPLARRLVALPLPGGGVFQEGASLLNRELARLRHRIQHVRTSVRIVVTPERVVVEEGRRAWTELALFEVACDAVVLNRALPPEAAEEPFFRDQAGRERALHREVEALFAPHPVLVGPFAACEPTGLPALLAHGRALFAGRSPEARLSRAERVSFGRDGGRSLVRIPLPGADAKRLDVAKLGAELVVTAGSVRRSLVLPRRMAALALAAARLEGGVLHVALERPASEPAPVRAGAAAP